MTKFTRQHRVITVGFLIATPALLQHLLMLWQDSGSFYILGGLDLRTLHLAVPLAARHALYRVAQQALDNRDQMGQGQALPLLLQEKTSGHPIKALKSVAVTHALS
jgi:hypothetical protein